MDNKKKRQNNIMVLVPIAAGIALNYLFSLLAQKAGMIIYLDNIGTIVSAVIGGYIPGVITGLINNGINYYLDSVSIYYASISALIAICARYCSKRGSLQSAKGVLQFILVLAFIGGVLGGIITWLLFDLGTGGSFLQEIGKSFGIDLIDKSLTVSISLLILMALPDSLKEKMHLSGWKQNPMSDAEASVADRELVNGRSLNNKIALILITAAAALAIAITGVSSSIFRDYIKNQHLEMTTGVAKLVASTIDPQMVDRYIEEGEKAPGYLAAEARLQTIRDSSVDIEYVYVYKIDEEGCHVVFDLDTDELKGEEPGTLVPFDKSFEENIPALLAGEHIDPIETDDTYGWLLTAYEPVYNEKGECVCYAAADVAVRGILTYETAFIIKVVLLFLGFFILIMVVALWLAKYRIILPINSMALLANEFAYDDSYDESQAETALDRILDLKITTDDEVQNLYESFCKMTSDTVNHMKDIRKQNRVISRMQTGLIMIMADMVEGRDSDTGNHVRKTAAYTRILLEQLRELGYYTDKITDHYIDDVEQSAPLHDVGKIAVSDVILNKPGKLTDEEFEIMKTHASEGKRIIDQAISTVEGESYLLEARNMAGYHHEKWNGKGYPEGLSGEDIPLSARVMAIADVFDALTSKRVYKDAMPFEKAVSIIQNDAGTHFDPKCVEAFTVALDKFKQVLIKYKDLEEEGAEGENSDETADSISDSKDRDNGKKRSGKEAPKKDVW